MLLILRDPNLVLLIDDIRLDDGYLPAVGDFHPVWTQDGLPQIEPALWFKTDVITCVLLDIYQRSITWSSQPITEKHLEHFRSCDQDSIFVAMDKLGTKSDFDAETMDLDASYEEMFEAGEYLLNLQNLLNSVDSMSKKERKRASVPDKNTINKIKIKLLHCYLLPCLKIKPVQLVDVQNTLQKQEEFLAKIDEKLELKMNEVSRTKVALQMKRATMVEQFQTFDEVSTYPKEILLVMEGQFQEDIRNFNSELDKVQDEVNALKVSINVDTTKLAAKRKQRDDIVGKQIKFLMARENIINAVALEKPRAKAPGSSSCFVHEEGEFVVCDLKPRNYDMQSALWMYSKVYEVLQSQKEERAVLISKKNLMISVREALRETISSLQNGEATTGSSNNKTRSRRATDVLNSTVPDQWLTLTEKVSECLSTNSEHKNRHLRFVAKIQDKLHAAISVAKLAYRETADTALRLQRRRRSHYLVRKEIQSAIMTTQEDHREVKLEVATLLRTRANSCKKFRHRMDSIIQMDGKEADDDENELIQEQIKNEIKLVHLQIHAHFDIMSSEIGVELNEQSDMAYYKIWLCYEVHFYDDVMATLVRLYHLSYKLICSNLKRNAAHVTFEDLQVQEKWLQQLLFQGKDDVTSESDSDNDVADPSDVNVKLDVDDDVIELREKRRSISDTTSSSESDLENLNSIAKRLSVYDSSSLKNLASSFESVSSFQELRNGRKSLDSVEESMDENGENSGFSEKSASEGKVSDTVSEIEMKTFSDQSKEGSCGSANQDAGVVETEAEDSEAVFTNEKQGTRELTNQGSSDNVCSTNHERDVPTIVVNDEPLTDEGPESESENDDVATALPNQRRERFQQTKHNTLPPSMKPPRCLPANRSEAFKELFAVPMATVVAILDEETPLKKLQLMTKCVRQIQKAVTSYHEKEKKKEGLEILDDDDESMMCCDDFLSILTLILLHLEAKTLSDFYPHVVMLTDMMAPFLVNGLHSNSLTHFYGAYQIIFSTMVVEKAKNAKKKSL